MKLPEQSTRSSAHWLYHRFSEDAVLAAVDRLDAALRAESYIQSRLAGVEPRQTMLSTVEHRWCSTMFQQVIISRQA